MNSIVLTNSNIEEFGESLLLNERSAATVNKYIHDAKCFLSFLGGQPINRSAVLSYKDYLSDRYTTSSANSMIAAVNSFLKFLKLGDMCVKQFKVQRAAYCDESKELTRDEYLRLVNCAKMRKNERLSLVIETICSTGIRVSELKFVTVESLKKGEAVVNCKGKTRRVFLVSSLRKKLIKYAKMQSIVSGAVFITRNRTPISRHSIWREMKSLCKDAMVSESKVFPHNLRHLFARTFYGIERDIVKLADILGHSSIDTTRVYVISSGKEHRRKMENMRLTI